jgi:hypothetical protein
MNENNTAQSEEFVLRRLTEGVNLGGQEYPGTLWLAVLIPVVLLGIVYVIWMYSRDRRTIGWKWAAPLAMLRMLVYLILAVIFLLPAYQLWETTERTSRVLVLLDVSRSITDISDDLPDETAAAAGQPPKLTTRRDRLIDFLLDQKTDLMKRLAVKNPVFIYRFGSKLDDEPRLLAKGADNLSRAEWEAMFRFEVKRYLLDGLSEAGRELLAASEPFKQGQDNLAWADSYLAQPLAVTLPPGLSEEDTQRLKDNRDRLQKRVQLIADLLQGTDMPGSVSELLKREAGNMLAAVVVISDGRSTRGKATAAREVAEQAMLAKVPIYTIAVGVDRPPVSIRITDVQAPERITPDEKFVVRVEVDGEGLTDQQVPVTLELTRPSEPGQEPQKFALPPVLGTFKAEGSDLPHAQVEFTIDPDPTGPDQDKLVRLPETFTKEVKGRRELIEGEWKLTARVPRDKRERFYEPEHVSPPTTLVVKRKPVRVLLFAGGPTREFQFVRNLILRLQDKNAADAEMSILVQNRGRDGSDVQDVPPERRLSKFPYLLSTDEKERKLDPKSRYYNLAEYDVVVAFDPDWTELDEGQAKKLETWVKTQGGGIVFVGGSINSYQLAQLEVNSPAKVVLDLLPVVPGSYSTDKYFQKRKANTPYRLNFDRSKLADATFLKLDDDSPDPLGGWEEFFAAGPIKPGQPAKVVNGFYNYFPISRVKGGDVRVLASFGDEQSRTTTGDPVPYIVTLDLNRGRVIYLAAGEFWRLRQYSEAFYERFWTKLMRYAGSRSINATSRRGIVLMNSTFPAGKVRFQAQLFGGDGEYLPATDIPRASALFRLGETEKEERVIAKVRPNEKTRLWQGYFNGEMQITKPGDYQLEIEVPGSGEIVRKKFSVRASDPEIDYPQPDYQALYDLATEIASNELEDRLDKEVTEKLRANKNYPVSLDSKGVLRRRFFDLETADIIPAMIKDSRQVSRNRGGIRDEWDQGPSLGKDAEGRDMRIATALLLIVGLLSVEWLTRKLLRLA